jgi:hypothetical protein
LGLDVRPLSELLSPDPAFPVVQSWISDATRSVKVLTAERSGSEAVLLALQVTTRSPMGALALETGGLVVDGLLRVLGGAGPGMSGDLARWNGMGHEPLLAARDRALIIAHDALGGFFALDGGGLGEGKGTVFYFAPDALAWEDLGIGYSAWLVAMMSDSLRTFYADNLWHGWEGEVSTLTPDQGVSFYPPLWTKESRPIEGTSRKGVPMLELWHFQQDVARQLGGAG